MNKADVAALIEGIAPTLRAYINDSLSGFVDRIKALEERQPEKGPPGEKGERGPEGPQGVPGRDGRDGVQGISGEKGMDGINGRDGKDGINGKDGLGFDDLSVEHDGERGFTLKFSRGDEIREFPFTLPVVIDRGVHKTSEEYGRGDAVTFGGSLWIAQKDAPTDKPGQGDGWRLAVKKGRDAR